MAEYKDLEKKAIQLGKQTVRMCTEGGSGHPSSSLSILHLVTALMYRVMRYDPKDPWNPAADRLILSEGHAVPIIYAAYCDLGGVVGFPGRPSELRFDDALTLRAGDSVLDGHPNPAIGFPFFDSATGSLGQGLSTAAGLACAARLDQFDRKFYCIIGDGESREGQVWEALDFIVDHKLTTVRPIFNCNGQAQSDYVSPQQSAENLARKLEAFNYEVRIIDGHNFDQIFTALTAEATGKPIAIVAKTVKGWGVKQFLSGNYHGKPLAAEEVPAALADLDAVAAQQGLSGMPDVQVAKLTPPPPINRPLLGMMSAGSFTEACTKVGLTKALEKKELSTRKAYGAALNALGAADDRVVASDGDVKNSTFAEWFAKNQPARYFEARIAEQNMVSMAVGLAAGAKIPFVSTFGKFFMRAADQIEMAAVTNANVKLCGSHTGISLAADGPSQMAVSDVSFLRAYAHTKRADGAPACRLMLPSDAISAFKLTEAMANVDGLCYMRTHRPEVPFLYAETDSFPLGGFKHLVDGEDMVIVASGYMVHVARKALELLDKQGLSASLVDVYSLPLEADEILQIGDDCRGQILVLEDNYVGGVYDEIALAAAKSDLGVRVEGLVLTSIPKSARTPEETLTMAHLDPQEIVKVAQRMFDQSE